LAEKIDVKTSSDVCRRGYLIHNVYLRFSLKVPKRRLLIVQFQLPPAAGKNAMPEILQNQVAIMALLCVKGCTRKFQHVAKCFKIIHAKPKHNGSDKKLSERLIKYFSQDLLN